jgi:hypothetical protein
LTVLALRLTVLAPQLTVLALQLTARNSLAKLAVLMSVLLLGSSEGECST